MSNLLSAVPVIMGVSLLAGCQTTPIGSERIEVTEFRPKTPDGWTLELTRFRLKERSSSDRLPVILCHGMAANGRVWSLAEKVSLAGFLADDGYDVWVPSLRGSGNSTKPAISAIRGIFQLKFPSPRQCLNWPTFSEPEKFNWNFDDHVLKDLPTIIDTVKQNSGHSQVVWVGHSMGAMVMYGYLERCGRKDVAALVAVAGPIHIPQPPSDVFRMALRHRGLVRLGRTLVNIRIPCGIGALIGYLPGEDNRWNRQNMDRNIIRATYRRVMEDVSSGLIDQLTTVAETGHLKSADGCFDYTSELGRVTVPILCIAGKADNICEPAAVRFAYEHVGSTDKTYSELGVANGFRVDYGHIDLVLGKNARQEVYPLIRDWLHNRNHN